MSLRELLQTDMKTAMKERESGKERLSVLRMVWAAVRNKEIDEKTELTDDAVMAVLMKEVKQREDTIKEIKDANRPDLVAKNEEEIEILKKYLPEPLSDEELKKVIQDVIATTLDSALRFKRVSCLKKTRTLWRERKLKPGEKTESARRKKRSLKGALPRTL